jgi:uncharacterized membrane protein
MMTYTVAKYLHVVAAMAWVGGVLLAAVLTARSGSPDDEVAAAAITRVNRTSSRVIGPAAVLTLLAGIVTTMIGGIAMSTLWVVWGYAGVAVTMVLGGGVLGRTTARLERIAVVDGRDTPEAVGLQQRINRIGLVNLAVLLSTVWAMVAKPSW